MLSDLHSLADSLWGGHGAKLRLSSRPHNPPWDLRLHYARHFRLALIPHPPPSYASTPSRLPIEEHAELYG